VGVLKAEPWLAMTDTPQLNKTADPGTFEFFREEYRNRTGADAVVMGIASRGWR
jgi:hypothetical protein